MKILSVVKANAYGHGAGPVARALEAEGSAAFGVATLEEGIELRDQGIQIPILVLAGVYPEQLDQIVQKKLTPSVCNPAMLEGLEHAAKSRGASLSFHLKVDTGMGRIGFSASETGAWISELAKLKALRLDGLFSHFASAESVDTGYTQKQLELFRHITQRLHEQGHKPPWIHLANSAAVITLPSAHFSMVRPGLMLYGLYPSKAMTGQARLKPALSWRTRILQLKRVPKGSSISYGQTFVTKTESLIATLPVGYADGYSRLMTNRGSVLVRGQKAPVVGRVCMDLTMVDVTDIRGVVEGDEVLLLGQQGETAISADEMAQWAETISYEILTSISARVPRIHYSSKEA